MYIFFQPCGCLVFKQISIYLQEVVLHMQGWLVSIVHGKKKSAAGHMDQLLKKTASPRQKLLVHTPDVILPSHFARSPDYKIYWKGVQSECTIWQGQIETPQSCGQKYNLVPFHSDLNSERVP